MWTDTPIKNATENLHNAITSNLTQNFNNAEMKWDTINSLLGNIGTCNDNAEPLKTNVEERFGEGFTVQKYCDIVRGVINNIAK